MKYRVVGWTYYDNTEIEYVDFITYAERNVIIDDIRKNGYFFGGYEHQECFCCVPVLNDGKMRIFSQRNWGSIMAEAYGDTREFAYSAYMHHFNLDEQVIPTLDYDLMDFVPETDLAEDFSINVEKTVIDYALKYRRVFLNDLKELRYIDGGDTIILNCGKTSVEFLVEGVDRDKNVKRKNSPISQLIDTDEKIILYVKRKQL